MRLFFSILLILSLLFSECTINNELLSESTPIILAAILLSILIASIAYMVGRFMNMPRYLLFAKDQIFHSFVSVILLSSMIAIFVGLCAILSSFISTDYLHQSLVYTSALSNEGKNILSSLTIYSYNTKRDAAANGWGYNIPILGGETFYSTFYKNAFASHADLIYNFVLAGFLNSAVYSELFRWLPIISLSILIPFGIILRSVPFIRSTGNTMIAMGIAIYSFLPFFFAVNSLFPMPGDPVDVNTSFVQLLSSDPISSSVNLMDIGLFLFHSVFLSNLAFLLSITSVMALNSILKVVS